MTNEQSQKFKKRKFGMILVLTFLISSCSNEIDQKLSLSCEKLKINLDALHSNQEEFESRFFEKANRFNSLGADWDSSSRKDLIDYVNTHFPVFSQYLNEEFFTKFLERDGSNRAYKNSIDNLIRYVLLVESLKDTGFELEFSDSEVSQIIGETDSTSKENAVLINNEIERIMGSFVLSEAGITGSSGCSLVTEMHYEKYRESPTYGKPGNYLEDYLLSINPGTVFVMRAEGGLRKIFYNMADVVLCETKGETEEYMAVGDGTPGKYSVNKCRQ
jgi:hypothetical protein